MSINKPEKTQKALCIKESTATDLTPTGGAQKVVATSDGGDIYEDLLMNNEYGTTPGNLDVEVERRLKELKH